MAFPLLLLLCSLLLSHHPAHSAVLLPTDPSVQIRGRVVRTLTNVSFDWEGVALRFSVSSATTVGFLLSVPAGMGTRFSVLLDGQLVSSLLVSPAEQNYTLLEGLSAASHEVQVYHEIEPAFVRGQPAFAAEAGWGGSFGAAAPTITALWSDGDFSAPSPPFPIKLMIVGDSLSSGFGANGTAPCRPSLATNAHSLTYGALLCEHCGAECIGTVAWAGKGLLVNSPSSSGGPAVPSYLFQALGTSSMVAGARDWDFNRPSRPDVVVLNLLTNDCGKGGSACLSNASFAAELVAAYVRLADQITHSLFSGYPTLFLASGPFTQAYEPLVLQAIEQARLQRNLTLHFLNFSGAPLDGCDGHPGRMGHQAMLQAAAEGISSVMGWKAGEGRLRQAAAAAAEAERQRLPASPPQPPPSSAASAWAAGSRVLTLPGLSRAAAAPAGPAAAGVNVSVYSDGSGDYSSISQALELCCTAGSAGGELRPVTLHIRGTFRERVVLPAGFLGGLTILGDPSSSPLQSLIISNVSGAHPFWTFNTHTLLVAAQGVTLVNVAIANDAGSYSASAGQSVALHVDPTGDRFACFHCMLLGGIDTIYTGSAGYGLRSFFFDSFANGTGDSIFGGSSSVFEQSHVDMSFTVTAARGDNSSSAFLFLNSTVSANGGKVELGRPWGQDSQVVFKDCWLDQGVTAAGWDDWGHSCDKGSGWCAPLLFAEANSSGPGASPMTRPAWTSQLSGAEAAAWTRARVLQGWDPVAAASGPASAALLARYAVEET